jgi:hypothetical protein
MNNDKLNIFFGGFLIGTITEFIILTILGKL